MFGLEVLLEYVQRHLQMSGSRTSVAQDIKGFRYQLWNLFRTIRAAVPFRYRFGESQLVHGVEQAAPFFSGSGVDLTRDEEHRDRVTLSDGQPGGRVGDAGTRRHAAHAHLSWRPSIAVGHECSRLFVPYEDVLYFRMPIQRIVNCHRVRARDSKHNLHAMANERFHDELTAGHDGVRC